MGYKRPNHCGFANEEVQKGISGEETGIEIESMWKVCIEEEHTLRNFHPLAEGEYCKGGPLAP
jgi:hypothetical protein